jgi:hypothetical protein
VAKFQKAQNGTTTSRLAFDELTASISADLTEKWGQSEAKAMHDRGDYLKIYDVEEDNSERYYYLL